MGLFRGKALVVTLTIALGMILIFGFQASAQKKHDQEAASKPPEPKTTAAAATRQKSSGMASFSLHPAARYTPTRPAANEEEPEDFTENTVHGAFFPRADLPELVQTDLNSFIRTSDNGNSTADNTSSAQFASSPSSPTTASSPLLFYPHQPTATSTNNPTSSPTVNPASGLTPTGNNSSYVPAGNNSSYVPAGTSSPTPVPSSLFLLASGLIVFGLLRGTLFYRGTLLIILKQ